jgi:hypothetical protein
MVPKRSVKPLDLVMSESVLFDSGLSKSDLWLLIKGSGLTITKEFRVTAFVGSLASQ